MRLTHMCKIHGYLFTHMHARVQYIYIYRRLGGESEPGNLNGSCVRDPVAGILEFD